MQDFLRAPCSERIPYVWCICKAVRYKYRTFFHLALPAPVRWLRELYSLMQGRYQMTRAQQVGRGSHWRASSWVLRRQLAEMMSPQLWCPGILSGILPAFLCNWSLTSLLYDVQTIRFEEVFDY